MFYRNVKDLNKNKYIHTKLRIIIKKNRIYKRKLELFYELTEKI